MHPKKSDALSGSDTFYVYVAFKKCAGLLVSKPDSALIYWQNPPPVITIPHGKMAVSYTHLTLPTIYSV